MIKAAFFDIDGTLVSLKTKVYPASARAAIAQARKNGVLCFVATGRSKFEIASEHLLDGIAFDGYLTNNGQDAYAADGSLLCGKPIDPGDAAAILDFVEQSGCAAWLVSAEQSLLNFENDRVTAAMQSIHTQPPQLGDLRRLLAHPIYKIVLFLSREEMQTPLALAPHSRCTQWFPFGHDILSLDGGKRSAMLEILHHYGIPVSDSIAFGDSENDVEMLKAAGIGVCMGNGTPEARAAADYITADCDENGLAKAMQHFGLLSPSPESPSLVW